MIVSIILLRPINLILSEVNELEEAKKEIAMLKAQLGNASVFESVGGGLYGKKVNLVDDKKSKSHLKVRRKSEHLTAEEFFDNESDSESEEESSGLNDDDDPEWKVKNTPLMKSHHEGDTFQTGTGAKGSFFLVQIAPI